MIYDLDRFFITHLDEVTIPILKTWSGIGRTVDTGLLFRSRSNFGLGLTSLVDHFSQMQLVKCQLLDSSSDESIQVYSNLTNTESLRKPEYGKLLNCTQLLMLKWSWIFTSQHILVEVVSA